MPERGLESPVGPLTLVEKKGEMAAVRFARTPHRAPSPLLREAEAQLRAYFDGRLMHFDLPLAPAATEFQQRVRTALLTIPYGRTRTYGMVAQSVASGARAVARACASNPLPILVPCHRVVAADGGLGGYSGGRGRSTKRWLLDHETRYLS